ncbi:hypothetical protein ACT7C6_11875 [Bacillus paranthracis]
MAKKIKQVTEYAVSSFFLLNGKNGIIFIEIPPTENAGSQNTFKFINTIEEADMQFCKTLTVINSHDKHDQDYIYSYKHNEYSETATAK